MSGLHLALPALMAAALLFCPAHAFSQGNLLVLRVGALDGSSLDESSPSSEDFLRKDAAAPRARRAAPHRNPPLSLP